MTVFAVAASADVALQYATTNPSEGAKHATDLLDLIAKTSLGTLLGMLGGWRDAQ